ncbi:MAG TPA: CPBP family intramembrane glutamic endopeptidase [Kofleriaceae bacterium]|nr:CPBP family intramembrane glutamic endopeptidase [Kofleriaceae bacterium]
MKAISRRSALLLMPLAFVASLVVAVAAQAFHLPPFALLPIVMLLGIAGPALVAASDDPRAELGLTAPSAHALAGAVLVGGSFWYVNAAFIAPWFAGAPSASDRQLAELVGGADRLALKILVIALVPAVCEELLVRGAIARGLAARHGLWLAVAVSSIYFAAMHLSLARAAPTAALGALLAVAALRSGSTIPAMLIHFLNNAIALTLAATAAVPDPRIAAPVALAATIGGTALLWQSHRR